MSRGIQAPSRSSLSGWYGARDSCLASGEPGMEPLERERPRSMAATKSGCIERPGSDAGGANETGGAATTGRSVSLRRSCGTAASARTHFCKSAEMTVIESGVSSEAYGSAGFVGRDAGSGAARALSGIGDEAEWEDDGSEVKAVEQSLGERCGGASVGGTPRGAGSGGGESCSDCSLTDAAGSSLDSGAGRLPIRRRWSQPEAGPAPSVPKLGEGIGVGLGRSASEGLHRQPVAFVPAPHLSQLVDQSH